MRELVCALCALRQPVAAACSGCGVAFGAYACLTCRFFDDDLQKRQFHCAACGICRVGGAENFFHCATCGCCYARSLQVGCWRPCTGGGASHHAPPAVLWCAAVNGFAPAVLLTTCMCMRLGIFMRAHARLDVRGS